MFRQRHSINSATGLTRTTMMGKVRKMNQSETSSAFFTTLTTIGLSITPSPLKSVPGYPTDGR